MTQALALPGRLDSHETVVRQVQPMPVGTRRSNRCVHEHGVTPPCDQGARTMLLHTSLEYARLVDRLIFEEEPATYESIGLAWGIPTDEVRGYMDAEVLS